MAEDGSILTWSEKNARSGAAPDEGVTCPLPDRRPVPPSSNTLIASYSEPSPMRRRWLPVHR
ncbi:hypothetical protein, partial [Methanocalculus sp.]|uniref:hypothetical protein n=1 Tax=Methanocalculus sp. TaxID=2004547 RepID=UPI002606A040